MQRHFNISDGAVFLGAALMIISVLGMSFDSNGLVELETALGLLPNTEPMYLQAVPVRPEQPALPTWTPFSIQMKQPAAAAQAATPEPNLTYLSAVGSTPTALTESAAPTEPADLPAPPAQPPLIPDRIVIPAIMLDAPIVPGTSQIVEIDGQTFQQWEAPTFFAAGWQTSSATLGVPGNIVLSGHHNVYGEVFGRLIDLQENDIIQVLSGGDVFNYRVISKMILPERGEPLAVRLDNAKWMLPTKDERLTLVTCWPQVSNTHRLIIVAVPAN